MKNFGRALGRDARQISFRCENLKIIKVCPRRQNFLLARAPKKSFINHILHKILYLPVILNLKSIGVDWFEVGFQSATSERHCMKNPLPLNLDHDFVEFVIMQDTQDNDLMLSTRNVSRRFAFVFLMFYMYALYHIYWQWTRY